LINRLWIRLRWLRRRLTRAHWAARLLDLVVPEGRSAGRGLIMIQIDGLSRTQFERALREGRLPFLWSLILGRRVELRSFYSGLPSTTPAVQAEIFYGIKCAVPGFQFMERTSMQIQCMYESEASRIVEERLLASGNRPLLEGGHSYSNIYRAGAAGSWYCSQDLDVGLMLRRVHPLKGLLLGVAYSARILRIIGLGFTEVVLALVDLARGSFARADLWAELKFVPARIFICILVREMIRFRVLLDIEAGLRVIHANFLGYDEQSHRRGPGSAFAHWSLKGIDRAIRDICKAAQRSGDRHYDVLIYSDHGQEATQPFSKVAGRGLEEVVEDVMARGSLAGRVVFTPGMPRVIGSAITWCRTLVGAAPVAQSGADGLDQKIVITALGPFGHLYLPMHLGAAELEERAHELVGVGVPLVAIRPDTGGGVVVVNRRGRWRLPEDGKEVFGDDHPFHPDIVEDFIELAYHANAGDLMVCGWDAACLPMTFPNESGAHGGPGKEETGGFVLLPVMDAGDPPASRCGKTWLRGLDLRNVAFKLLGGGDRSMGRDE